MKITTTIIFTDIAHCLSKSFSSRSKIPIVTYFSVVQLQNCIAAQLAISLQFCSHKCVRLSFDQQNVIAQIYLLYFHCKTLTASFSSVFLFFVKTISLNRVHLKKLKKNILLMIMDIDVQLCIRNFREKKTKQQTDIETFYLQKHSQLMANH